MENYKNTHWPAWWKNQIIKSENRTNKHKGTFSEIIVLARKNQENNGTGQKVNANPTSIVPS
jgi:hypothetical protein